MTAHNDSNLNHDWLRSDNLCVVIDRAYRGIASIQKSLARPDVIHVKAGPDVCSGLTIDYRLFPDCRH